MIETEQRKVIYNEVEAVGQEIAQAEQDDCRNTGIVERAFG